MQDVIELKPASVEDAVQNGAIRIRHYQGNIRLSNANWISPVFVIPAFQNHGIAQKAIQKAFALYPQIITWKLDAIKQEAGNCHLYEKCGFVRTGKEHIVNEYMTLVVYERQNAV